MSALVNLVAVACLCWYLFVVSVQIVGIFQIYNGHSKNSPPASSPNLPKEEVPHITILRPVKGLDPWLYECLASTFRLGYPRSKLTISICVSSRNDPAFPVLKKVLADFPGFDAKIFVEQEDDRVWDLGIDDRGPNPKIRNLSRAYRDAPSDIVWIVDCNVWIEKSTAGRMVDKLCGYGPNGTRVQPYRFVHQLPIVVEAKDNYGGGYKFPGVARFSSRKADSFIWPTTVLKDSLANILRTAGGRLEEMFMATSHAKFYTAINAVGIAPCVVGNSNMFRRSHLDFLTAASSSSKLRGIDFFSHSLSEDQLIGTVLWQETSVIDQPRRSWGKHAIISGSIVIQPVSEMPVDAYIARRVRWQRVRKSTAAIWVEPGVESLLCSAVGAFAITTLPFSNAAFALIWGIGVLVWITADWLVYTKLHSCISVEVDSDTPSFALPPARLHRRSLFEWIVAWMCRELLALPIWCIAVFEGSTVVWRSQSF